MDQGSILCHHHRLALVVKASVPEDPPRPSSNQHDLRMATPFPKSPAPRRLSCASDLNLGADAFALDTGTLVEGCIQAAIRRGQRTQLLSGERMNHSHAVILYDIEEIRRVNREKFEEMCTILDSEPSASSLYLSAQQIFQEIFEDNTINWGRILTMLAFGQHLAQYCSKKSMGEVTESLTPWIAAFICTRLEAWIVEHGGWAGLAELKEPQTKRPLKHQEEGWLQTAISGMELGIRFYSFISGSTT